MSLCVLRCANLKWVLAHPLSLTLFAGFLRVRPKGSNKIVSAESLILGYFCKESFNLCNSVIK